MPLHRVIEQAMSEMIDNQQRIVCHKIHHRMLTYKIHKWHSLHRQRKQNPRKSTKRKNRIHDSTHRTLHILVQTHVVLTMIMYVEIDKKHDEYGRN